VGIVLGTGIPFRSDWARTILLSLALVGCAAGQDEGNDWSTPDSDPMFVDVGAELFETHCASCHGADARGNGPAASALNVPPTDLTRIAARHGGTFPESSIARVIDGRFDLSRKRFLLLQPARRWRAGGSLVCWNT